jgi:hypothetical protein
MATGARGEGYLRLDGEQIPILFTLRALADAERLTGKTVMQLMAEAQRNSMGVGDLAQLLAVGMEHARRENSGRGKAYNANDAWRLLDGLGFTTVAVVVFEALAAVMSYNRPQDDSDPPA